ncbi:MAG: FAD-binding oxidoreductase [Bacteroidetes bacterium]|nr:FAD-binding oxidoreductase [Bacteroidota bacterium]
METSDYLIVGLGLAGVSLCEMLEHENISFQVIDSDRSNASKVAGGLYNPIVLKRFTPIWEAENQMAFAAHFYKKLEQKLQQKLDYKIDVVRKFANLQEIEKWKAVSKQDILKNYMYPVPVKNNNENIRAIHGLGCVEKTGRVDTEKLVDSYKSYLLQQHKIQTATFDYTALKCKNQKVIYKDTVYKRIVFAEGMQLTNNPYFNYLPLIPNKGQLVEFESKKLCLKHILKGPVFIIPLENDSYLCGSTYERTFENELPTKEGFEDLMEKLNTMVDTDIKVLRHYAGIRPTVKDRRPLVGKHPVFSQLYVLNGMGTRGVLLAPSMANALFQHIEKGLPLPKEIDIKRYQHYCESEAL